MALVSQAEFSRLAKVTKTAITQAVARARLRLTADGSIDTKDRLSVGYLSRDHIPQRQAAHRKAERVRGRAVRDSRPTDEAVLAMWARGDDLPSGWSVAGLADRLDERGRCVALYFLGPAGRAEDEIVAELAHDDTYTLDWDRDVAIDRKGKSHALEFKTFGEPPWWCA